MMKACNICNNTGWELVERDGQRFAVRCKCFTNNVKKKLRDEAQIPARYHECTVSTFKCYNDTTRTAHGQVLQFLSQFPADARGLLLMGPCGVGKTHLGVGILNYLIDVYQVSCLFYDFRELTQELRSSYNPQAQVSESEIFEKINRAKVLLLDELGAEKISGWLLDTLTYLINHRYNNRQILIMTTNYMDTPDKRGEENLQERIGYRLRSRLYEMCETIIITGEDYRRTHYYEKRGAVQSKDTSRRGS